MIKRLILILAVFAGGCYIGKTYLNPKTEEKYIIDTIPSWEVFTRALIQTESGGNPNAIGKTNDVGILQLTPIYVRDANRIAHSQYTLDDRYDVEKSLEMFTIINDHYNPDHDIDKAIQLHNPTAGDWYMKRVKKYMAEQLSEYAPGNLFNNTTIISSSLRADYSIIIVRENI